MNPGPGVRPPARSAARIPFSALKRMVTGSSSLMVVVLEHLQDLLHAMGIVSRFMKPDGTLVPPVPMQQFLGILDSLPLLAADSRI